MSHTSCVMNEPVFFRSFFVYANIIVHCVWFGSWAIKFLLWSYAFFLADDVECWFCCCVSPFLQTKRPALWCWVFVWLVVFVACNDCLLHLNIVAHNLHVVYCQFCRRAFTAHCSVAHNLCVLARLLWCRCDVVVVVVSCSLFPLVMYSQHPIDFKLLDFGIFLSLFFKC